MKETITSTSEWSVLGSIFLVAGLAAKSHCHQCPVHYYDHISPDFDSRTSRMSLHYIPLLTNLGMCYTRFMFSPMLDLFADDRSNFIGLVSVLEHWVLVNNVVVVQRAKMSNDSQNDSSSKVLPDVSGKKRYMNTTSNTNQQQYTNSHFQATRSSPIGLT